MKLNYIFEKGGNKNNQITLEKSTSPKNCKTTDIEKERKYLLEFNNVKQKSGDNNVPPPPPPTTKKNNNNKNEEVS